MIAVLPATNTDLPALVEFWYEKWALLSQSDARIRLAPDARARWLDAARIWISDANSLFCAVTDDARTVGFAVGRIDAALMPGLMPTGIITDIALDAHGSHAGAARALVAALRAGFAARGIEQIVVWTARQQPVEQAFWRGLGATEWMDGLWLKQS
ncbi:MAG: GNAT family N-acetyltransferase [Chloroflexota bacterium]|nr:GNAT family N-acetyltransferase [Chloroflexota bacterium]